MPNPPTLGFRRILVTGAAGFIGSHLCEALLASGHEVLGVDNYATGTRRNIAHLLRHPQFEMKRHDIIWPLHVEVDAIFNLANAANPRHPRFDPVQATKVCVQGVISMLGLARRTVATLVHASCSTVYGDGAKNKYAEDDRGSVDPISVAACGIEGKRCAETLCFDYRCMHDLPIKVVRIFDVYGPRMQVADGRLISTFIAKALAGRPIELVGDGHQTGSFCYVDDLVDGLLRMMATPPDVTGPINLGQVSVTSMRHLAKRIIAQAGSRSEIVCRSTGDAPISRCPDIAQARSVLGWRPTTSLGDPLDIGTPCRLSASATRRGRCPALRSRA